jgi:hypothetical protein
MTPVIQQSVRFRTSPQSLFDMYLDSRKHTRSTAAPARISRKTGGKFTAFGRKLEGKNLLIIPGKQIVQFWRATHSEEWRLVHLGADFQQGRGRSTDRPRAHWCAAIRP